MSDFYIHNGILKEYLGPGGEVRIPEGVTEIGFHAFSQKTGIGPGCRVTGVIIPEGVRRIGEYAFSNCVGLASVNLPESLKRMELRAFRGCTALTEIVLPDSVISIAPGTFSGCKALTGVTLSAGLNCLEVNLFRDCASLKSVRIPDGVTSIRSMAFSGCKKLECVEVPASVTEISYDAFSGCCRLQLIAPHIAPQDVVLDLRIPLMLGYCANPKRYAGETAERYAQYASNRNNKKDILEAAGKCLAKVKAAVMAYYGVEPAPKAPRNVKAGPYDNLSEQKKVLLLEEAVLSGGMEKLEEVLTGCKTFECTARALGLACRYGSLEMVRRLVKAGASFNYRLMDSRLTAKYGLYTVYRGMFGKKTVYHRFEYLLIEDDLSNEDRIGDLRNIRDKLCTGSKERPPIMETQRAEILRWLARSKEAGCYCSMLLRTAILEDKPVLADALADEGVQIKDYDLSGCPDSRLMAVTNRMLDITGRQGVKMPVNLPLLKRVMDDAKLVTRLLDEGAVPEKLDTTAFLKSSLDANNAGTLALCLERGFLKSTATREKLIAQSIAAGKTEHTAVLLEYKNRTADFAKERAAEEARLMKDLTAASDSVYMLKQLWKYRKREDGTLCITGYKGTAPEIAVPAKIGRAAVTGISTGAFSPKAHRLTEAEQEARKAIRSVTIPDSVRNIGDALFDGCTALTHVTFPAGLKEIGSEMFQNCAALNEIAIPEGVKTIGPHAFEGCIALKKIAFPATLRKIGHDAFVNCKALAGMTLPKGFKEISHGAFKGSGLETLALPWGMRVLENQAFMRCEQLREVLINRGVKRLSYGLFQNCKNLARVTLPATVIEINAMVFSGCPAEMTIRAPAASYAEQFAKANFYKFEAP